jgi:hypothetical protein
MAGKKVDKAGLAALAEELRKNAREAKTQKFLKDYKINPDNWLALLGRRAASRYVLKDPLSQDVRTWDTPINRQARFQTLADVGPAEILGSVEPDFKWAGDPKKQREAAQRYARQTLIERGHNPLMHRIRSETGYDFSDPLKTQGKISLGPEALQDNNYVAEHEFMHRGQQEADIERGELTPYAYQAVKGIGLHPYSAGEMSFKSKYGRDPTSGDKARLEQDLAAAKEEYERRYTSGPSGGMPYEFQPNLGDTPPSSIMDRIKALVAPAPKKKTKAKAKGGAITIDDGNPAKRRKLI